MMMIPGVGFLKFDLNPQCPGAVGVSADPISALVLRALNCRADAPLQLRLGGNRVPTSSLSSLPSLR